MIDQLIFIGENRRAEDYVVVQRSTYIYPHRSIRVHVLEFRCRLYCLYSHKACRKCRNLKIEGFSGKREIIDSRSQQTLRSLVDEDFAGPRGYPWRCDVMLVPNLRFHHGRISGTRVIGAFPFLPVPVLVTVLPGSLHLFLITDEIIIRRSHRSSCLK